MFPESVYYNGTVLTVDEQFSVFDSFAVRGDRFVAVGDSDQILELAGPETEIVDLAGRTVIPGLLDDHYHFLSNAGIAFRQVSLVNATSFEEFLDLISEKVKEAPKGEVITTQSGWLPDQFDGRLPTRSDLDRIAPENPVIVRGGHTMFLNSAALEVAGISNATPAPEGGVISRDPETAEITGELIDNAMHLVRHLVPEPTFEDKVDGLRRAQPLLHSVGLTGIRDPGVPPEEMRVYQYLWDRGELTVRVSTSLRLDSSLTAEEILSGLSQWGVHTRFGNEFLRLDGIGEFGIDGGFQAGLMRQPYQQVPDVETHDEEFFGLQRIPTEKFTAVITGLNRLGWRACVHAVGDRGIDLVLEAYRKADSERTIRDRRWTIEHGHVTHPDQFPLIRELGLIISSQFHPYMGSRTMVQNWGERGEQSVPVRQWLDNGLTVGVGTDWTLMPPNPFEVLYFLVTRKNRYGEEVGAEQRISRQEALRLATIGNAYITFEESLKGSIEAGKLADFVILDRDYLEVADEEIKDIAPVLTVVGGKVVFRKRAE